MQKNRKIEKVKRGTTFIGGVGNISAKKSIAIGLKMGELE
jgi:hypothetical protein